MNSCSNDVEIRQIVVFFVFRVCCQSDHSTQFFNSAIEPICDSSNVKCKSNAVTIEFNSFEVKKKNQRKQRNNSNNQTNETNLFHIFNFKCANSISSEYTYGIYLLSLTLFCVVCIRFVLL